MAPLLGLDYGSRRVGIAVSDESDTLATAIGTHRSGRDGSLFARLHDLIDERRITALVLGLPLTAAGREEKTAGQVRAFAAKLETEFGLPVILVDERFSSREAENYLRQGGRRRRGKEAVDATAAEIILQRHLDGRSTDPEASHG